MMNFKRNHFCLHFVVVHYHSYLTTVWNKTSIYLKVLNMFAPFKQTIRKCKTKKKLLAMLSSFEYDICFPADKKYQQFERFA